MSLVGFSARTHPQQAVRDEVDDRRTPRDVFGPLHAVHRFTIDVAASDKNHLVDRYYTRHTDAFLHSWAGERVWCNPPFSRLMPWLEKTWAEMRGGCELVVMLIPANRCEQPFWQRHVEPYRDAPPPRWNCPPDALSQGPHPIHRARCAVASQGRPAAVRVCGPHVDS